jgi:hypothetical protein
MLMTYVGPWFPPPPPDPPQATIIFNRPITLTQQMTINARRRFSKFIRTTKIDAPQSVANPRHGNPRATFTENAKRTGQPKSRGLAVTGTDTLIVTLVPPDAGVAGFGVN